MTTLSLFDLNEFIRRVIALNFQQPIWVTAEIEQINESRGHFYLNLLQKSEGENGEIIATGQAILWSKTYFQIRANLGKTLDEILQAGLQVKMQVEMEFNERFGLRLLIKDVDPNFTFGQAEMQRRKTIEILQKTGLLQKNAALRLPQVLQKIAIISSETAAGLQDFLQHLNQNFNGYRFDLQLFTTAMQGTHAETEIPTALEKIKNRATDFDCVVFVRGGGARLDLAVFDQLEICRAVANFPLPVFTGIGHETDETVLDLTANLSLKTPTAVADFLVQHNFLFENSLLEIGSEIQHLASTKLKIKDLELANFENNLRWMVREKINRADFELSFLEKNLPQFITQKLETAARNLAAAELICQASDPQKILRRGFTITKTNGKIMRSYLEAERTVHLLETIFPDGVAWSKV